jgi:hypothetical protein
MVVRFVMGRGVTFEPQIDDEKLKGRVEAWWDTVARINKWDELEDEIVYRTLRDGETFIRRFTHELDGPREFELSAAVKQRLQKLKIEEELLGGADIPEGVTIFRILDPDQIKDPTATIADGIVISGNDVQHVLGYVWVPGDDSTAEFIPADDVLHTKINVDMDVPRGRSDLEILMQPNKLYEVWQGSRIALGIARSAVVLHKKVDGTPAQGRAIRDEQAVGRVVPGNDRKIKAFKPGTTIVTGKGTELEFKSANLQAQDAQHDGRSILLNMAASKGMPEFMFTADASNSNFASTLVSEGPAFRKFEAWQDFFTPKFAQLYRWAIVAGAKAGQIDGLSEEEAMELEVTVKWPSIQVRDELDHTQANMIRHESRVLSRQGWSEDDGIDFDIEQGRIEQEDQADVEFTGPSEE